MNKLPMISLIICSVLLLFYLIRKNNNFIDMRNIVKEHFGLFKNDVFSIIILIIMPFIAGTSCVFVNDISKELLGDINTFLSIFVTLQFSTAGILCSIPKGDSKYNKIKSEAFNEILFESVLTLVSILISFVIMFIDINNINPIVLKIISGLLYVFLFSTILNIFVVLKRLKFLFNENK